MSNIIEVKKINKSFKEDHILKNISFNVKQGEIFGFLGPSGAGKTTTIKLMTSQLKATSGEINILNENIKKIKNKLFDNIGVLSDTSGLYERLSIEDNLKFFGSIYNISKQQCLELLKRVDLYEHRKKKIKKISRGMKQRLLIAIAIIHKPKLLFLDEPTSALDPGTAKKVHALLRELNEQGATIFLTTHNMEEADKLCDRVAFLNNGQIVKIGKPQELKLEYREDYFKVTIKGEENSLKIKKDLLGLKQIEKWMQENKLLTVHSQEPNLEEIFLMLTGRTL